MRPHIFYTDRCVGGKENVTDLSTEKASKEKGPRVQSQNGDRKRQKGACPPPCKGSRPSDRIVIVKNTVSLNQNTLFRRLYYRGKPQYSPILLLHSMPNGLSYNRFGITVSKKLGKAVRRNKVRRRIYEAFRRYEPSLKAGFDIVIVAKVAASDADFNSYCRVIGGMLRKANLYL